MQMRTEHDSMGQVQVPAQVGAVDLVEHHASTMLIHQLTKLPGECLAGASGAHRIAHRNPALTLHLVHQKGVLSG